MFLAGATPNAYKICRECNERFHDHTPNRRMKYCTPRCRGNYLSYKYFVAKFKNPVQKRVCKWCHMDFETTIKVKKFCCAKCCCLYRNDVNSKRKVIECHSPKCSKRFRQNRGYQKYCSKKCATYVRNTKFNLEFRGETVVRNLRCPYCGTIFLARGLKRCYCSKKCRMRMVDRITRGTAQWVPKFKVVEEKTA